ncbi:MAG: YchJ family protein [Chitinispirillaceae bacterium]|nr:YchJ family protein [Chitinispirillaceae bacterium]
MELCPCGSRLSYADCCEPFISGAALAPTAEKLMRARYSAYAKTAVDFIIATMIEEKRKECDEKAIRTWSELSTWHKLEIVTTEKGSPDDTEGVVEFIAHFSEDGIRKNYHEKGTFRKVNGAWLYLDGEIQKQKPYVRSDVKPSRNDLCSCGSGKKYKRCCGK